MPRPYRAADYAVLMIALGIGVAVSAQQRRPATTDTPVSVTSEILAPDRRRGRPAAWRLDQLWPHAGRDALQPAEADQHHERETTGPGVVLRDGRRRRQSGRHAADVEQHALRHHDLERRVRARRAHRQGTVALGSARSNQPTVRPEDLLRHRESRHRALQRHDHRAVDRRPPVRARRHDRQAGVGNARRLSAGSVHAHDGAAHREGQGDHRRVRRRQADARAVRRASMRRPASWRGASTPCPAIRRSRSRTRRCEGRGQDLGRRVVEERRRRRGVGRHRVRSRSQPGLRRHRQRRALGAEVPRRAGPRQPVHLLDPRRGPDHRRAQVALPGRAERQLGLRQRRSN